jgi:hypothetical protein
LFQVKSAPSNTTHVLASWLNVLQASSILILIPRDSLLSFFESILKRQEHTPLALGSLLAQTDSNLQR